MVPNWMEEEQWRLPTVNGGGIMVETKTVMEKAGTLGGVCGEVGLPYGGARNPKPRAAATRQGSPVLPSRLGATAGSE